MPSLRFVPPAVERNAGFALLVTAFVGVAVMAGASGCGSSSATGSGDAGKKKDSGIPVIGDDDDDDDDGGQGDGGLGDDDDGGDASLLGPSYGSIALAQTATSAGAYSYTLTVGFSSTSGATGCTTKTLTPACVQTSCPASTSAPPSLSAGVVTVHLGTAGPTAPATPRGSSYPAPTAVTGQLFKPGDLLSASAAGASGGIAAFSAQAIAPDDIQVTTPSSFTGLSFPRSQPLTVDWGNGLSGSDTAGDSTKVQVVVATTSTSAVKTITCSFSAAELSGAVPLSGADGTDYVDHAGTGGVTGTISFTPTSTTEATAGTRAVTFVVTATGAAGAFTTTD